MTMKRIILTIYEEEDDGDNDEDEEDDNVDDEMDEDNVDDEEDDNDDDELKINIVQLPHICEVTGIHMDSKTSRPHNKSEICKQL